MPKVALVMGSKSDWQSLKGCVDVLHGMEIEVEVHVASAHRTPEKVASFAANARENGFEVIIAAAGKAAHLAGVIAGPHDAAGHRYSGQVLVIGRLGFPAFDRADADGHSGGDGCRWRRGQCGVSGGADSFH